MLPLLNVLWPNSLAHYFKVEIDLGQMLQTKSSIGLRMIADLSSLGCSKWTQSPKQKPKTHCQFEEEDRTSVNPHGDDLCKLGKNDERECKRAHQKGRKHSPARNYSRDEAGLEPQITEGSASKPGEHQANVIHIVMRTDLQPGQRLQSISFECLQVDSTA